MLKPLIKKISVLLILCLLPLVITGCWNNIDLSDRRFVVGVGLDKASNGQIDFSVQLLKPSVLESRKQGGSINATEVISSQGQTVFEAVRKLLNNSDHKLFYGHVQLIVIGEKLARQGFINVVDFFVRDTGPDKRTSVIIARGTTAREVLTAKGVQQDSPAVEIASTIKNTKAFPQIKETMLLEIMKVVNSKGKNLVVGVVTTPENTGELTVDKLNFTGAAVFSKDKLVGWLNPEETTGYLFAEGRIESGIINVTNPMDTTAKVSIEIFRSSAKKDVRFINGEPVLSIEIKEEGNVGEQQGPGDLTSFDEIAKLESETAQVIKKQVADVVRVSQEKYQVDIFGFGEIVHRKNLKYWQEVENNWNDVFTTLPVEIKVESKILRSGLIKKQAGEAK